jgi:hypothetical protein
MTTTRVRQLLEEPRSLMSSLLSPVRQRRNDDDSVEQVEVEHLCVIVTMTFSSFMCDREDDGVCDMVVTLLV